jgi:hypothetical protein
VKKKRDTTGKMQGFKMIREKVEEIKVRKLIRNERLKNDDNLEHLLFTVE